MPVHALVYIYSPCARLLLRLCSQHQHPAHSLESSHYSMWNTDDIKITTTTTLTTTGGTVWDAARHAGAGLTVCWAAAMPHQAYVSTQRDCLCNAVRYLEQVAAAIGLDAPGVRILELGAGCGFLGLTLARNLPNAALLCLTEQANGGALAHLQRNVELNRQFLGPMLHAVRTAECDWNDYASIESPAAAPHDVEGLRNGPPDSVDGRCNGGCSTVEDITAVHTGAADVTYGRGGDTSSSNGAVASSRIGTVTSKMVWCNAVGSIDRDGPGEQCSKQDMGANKTSFLASTAWDFIIGSDLIYNEAGARMLPRVLQALSQPHTQTYYVHTKHRFDHLDMVFLEQLEHVGLEWQEVRAPSDPSPPPSPPPLTDLFPEFRVAVYRIKLRVAGL